MAMRYGLLIGVERCAPDVAFFAEALKRRGFNIRALTDEAATLAHIRDGLDELVATAQAADVVAVFYAGPSAEQRAPGDDAKYALAPSGPDAPPDAMLRYRELAVWIHKLAARAREVAVVLNTSHAQPVAPLPPGAICMGAAMDGAAVCFTTESGVQYGAFSYFLGRALNEVDADAMYGQVFQRAISALASRFPDQRAFIVGDSERPAFGGGGAPTEGAHVIARTGGIVTIDVGAATGVTARSLWGAYTPASAMVGLVEIVDVGAAQAQARVLSESGSLAVGVGHRVEEEEHDYGDMRLRVGIAAGARDSLAVLQKHLAYAEMLELVDPSGVSDVVVTVRPSEADAKKRDVWIIEDRLGRAILPPRPMSDPAALRIDLEKLARHRNMLSLANPNPRSLLAGKVDLILRRRDGSRWTELVPDPRSGLYVLSVDDRICLEVRNDHDRPIYANVFDFGLLRAISPLGDNRGWTVQPHQQILIGDPDGFALSFPRGFEEASGIETIKLFAAGYPVDWSVLLTQQGLRGTRDLWDRTELSALLDFALTGRGAQTRRSLRIPEEQEWISVQRTFELQRKR